MLTLVAALLLHQVTPAAQTPTHRILNGQGLATLHALAEGASVQTLQFADGAEVAEHVHEKSDEILVILSGSFSVTIGDKKQTAGPGDTIHIPKGVKHSARASCPQGPPDAPTAAKALQVYTPAGPEQRFKQGEKVDKAAR